MKKVVFLKDRKINKGLYKKGDILKVSDALCAELKNDGSAKEQVKKDKKED